MDSGLRLQGGDTLCLPLFLCLTKTEIEVTNNLSTSRLVNATRSHDSLTKNMAVTHSTSLSNIVDMFFLAGASRTMSERDIITVWNRAYTEDPLLAIKCLFWARDIRKGAGERRFFRVIWNHFTQHGFAQLVHDLEHLIPEYGRWDDVWANMEALDRVTAMWFHKVLTEEKNGLLAKWLPRKGKIFSSMARHLELTPKELRKLLVELSDTVEQKMCAREWEAIRYSTVPSVAMNRYRKAFLKRDNDRFSAFILDVTEGRDKISAGAIFPHEIAMKCLGYYVDGKEGEAIVAQWNALPNYMEGTNERILPVCDVSGSMTDNKGLPMAVSVGLGVYISERNEGIFKDAFLTFSGTPEMVYLKGSLFQRMHSLRTASWGMNTNIQATFGLILRSATMNGLTEEDMPTKVLIISDMEFDRCGTGTNLEYIREQYVNAGYKLPQLVFWNVNGRMGNAPAKFNEQGIALVSGFSPAILKNILAGVITTPEKFVMDVLNSERYDLVVNAITPAG